MLQKFGKSWVLLKLFSKVAVIKFCKKHPRWISVLVAEHRPLYMNYVACCPWNFDADVSRNICN